MTSISAPSPVLSSSRHFTFSLSSCSLWGFDLDHTIVRYRLAPFHGLICRSLLDYLIQHYHYSSHFLTQIVFQPNFSSKCLLYDKLWGNLLQLDEFRRISHGIHGKTIIPREKLDFLYPDPIENPEGHGESRENIRFHCFFTYFESPVAQILSSLVELFDAGCLIDDEEGKPNKFVESTELPDFGTPHPIYGEFLPALHSGFQYLFTDYHRGPYFQAFRQSIESFIYPRWEIISWLIGIRWRYDCGTFLITNSQYDYSLCLMNYSFNIGKYKEIIENFLQWEKTKAMGKDEEKKKNPWAKAVDSMNISWILSELRENSGFSQYFQRISSWRDLFDILIIDGKKPGFFRKSTGDSFYPIVEDKQFSFPLTVDGGGEGAGLSGGKTSTTPIGNQDILKEMKQKREYLFRSNPLNDERKENSSALTSAPDCLYCHGNAEDLQEIFIDYSKFLNRPISGTDNDEEPQIIYFGDHLRSDIQALKKETRWLAGAIVEEMEWENIPTIQQSGKTKIISASDNGFQSEGNAEESSDDSLNLPGNLSSLMFADGYSAGEPSPFFHGFYSVNKENSNNGNAHSNDQPLPGESSSSYWHRYIVEHSDLSLPCVSLLSGLTEGHELVYDEKIQHYEIHR